MTVTRLKHDCASDRVSCVEGPFEKLHELTRKMMTLVLQLTEYRIGTFMHFKLIQAPADFIVLKAFKETIIAFQHALRLGLAADVYHAINYRHIK